MSFSDGISAIVSDTENRAKGMILYCNIDDIRIFKPSFCGDKLIIYYLNECTLRRLNRTISITPKKKY